MLFRSAQDATGTLEIVGGEVTLNSDQTFTDRTDYRLTDSNGVTTESDIATGTYTSSGSTVTLSPVGDVPYDLTLNGNALTQVVGSFTFTYRR